MKVIKGVVSIIGISALLVFAVACGDSEAAETPANGNVQAAADAPTDNTGTDAPAAGTEPAPAVGQPVVSASTDNTGTGTTPAPSIEPEPVVAQPVVGAPTLGLPAGGSGSTRTAEAVGFSAGAGQASVPTYQVGSTQAGIWVTGKGKLSVLPDIALVTLGVETTAKTLTEARDEAATAMDSIVAAVKRYNMTDRDIQTTSFNIWPDYQYQEVTKDGIRTNNRILIGYRVSNTAIIKVRDLSKVGAIIDDVVNAGGDATRINGVDFSIENNSFLMAQLREQAVKAALQNAQQFASLTGVALGKLVYIAETGGGSPVVQDFGAQRSLAFAEAAPATSISGGSLDLTLTVQAVFNIE